MSGKKITWIVVSVFILLVILRFAFIVSGDLKKDKDIKPIPVQIVKPFYDVITNKILLIGEVKGDTEVLVRPKTTGRVAEIYVDEGDYVEQGQKLMSYAAGITPDDELYTDLVTFAPVSGVVGVKYIKMGQQVVSTAGTNDQVFSIFKIDHVKVYADVPEKYVSDLKLGLLAEMKFDSYPGQIFKGKISAIRPVIDSNSRTAQIEIYANNPKHLIRPGMFAKIGLILKNKIKALIIPSDAIMEDVSKYVLTVENGRAMKKDIQTGILGSDFTEIAVGLTTTDEVIVVGQRVATAGSIVEIKPND